MTCFCRGGANCCARTPQELFDREYDHVAKSAIQRTMAKQHAAMALENARKKRRKNIK
jgi:hypothetical protein